MRISLHLLPQHVVTQYTMQDLCSAGVLCAKGSRAAAPLEQFALSVHMRLCILSEQSAVKQQSVHLIYIIETYSLSIMWLLEDTTRLAVNLV
jgi:hypothetical protein